MRVRVLGCHGGESQSHRPSCFLLDDKFLLDAGAVCRGLSLVEQLAITHAYLTHAHLDHVQGLPLLLDNIIGRREQPLEVIAAAGCAEAIEKSLFNGALWPDFTRLPTVEAPALRITRIVAHEPILVAGYTLHAIPMRHTVETHGVVVTDKTGSLAYSGDTGPTEEFWQVLGGVDTLKAVIIEVSFPNELEALALTTGHLTPALLKAELAKCPSLDRTPVLITHIKPTFEAQVKEQLAALGDGRIRPLRVMDELIF